MKIEKRHEYPEMNSGFLLLILFAGLMTGCASSGFQTKGTVPQAPAIVYDLPMHEPVSPNMGSLWNADSPMNDLFVTAKARRVGDILTVRIVESASAANNADTETERTTEWSGSLDKFFNLEKTYPAAYAPAIKAALSNTFEGTGTTKRSGRLAATITVRVTNVLHNGNLFVEGFREITVNNERQYITLAGIVRPVDINGNNEILSNNISDAKIAYSGVGVLNEQQKPGWLTRIINTISPF